MTTEVEKTESKTDHPHAAPHLIHIVVEVDGKKRPATLDRSPASGAEIRAAGGAQPLDDLSRLIHNKPSGGNITPGDMVEIKSGDQFIALATGTVS
jgi:hypothetical protein